MGNVIKNISTTAAVLGLAFSVAGNSSIVVSGNYAVPNYELFADASKNSENSSIIGYSQNNIYIDKEPLFFIFTLIILPTLGLITNLSIIIIYFKLLIRENLHPEYRLENKFLVQNQFYALFAFVFYIFAIVILANLLYIAGINLEIYKEIFTYPIYFYLFLIYTLIHIFIVKKV